MAIVTFLLDRSGSMESCWDDVLGGFNAFVKGQDPEAKLTLIQFDHEYQVSYEALKMGDVQPLTRETYKPRGSTALLDALGQLLKASTDPGVVVIFTDGLENASKTYTKAHIKDLVEQKTKDGWTFVYMGANQDAFAEAGSMGIGPAHTMNYDVTRTPEAMHRLSQTVSSISSN
jgi:hypothetical protein